MRAVISLASSAAMLLGLAGCSRPAAPLTSTPPAATAPAAPQPAAPPPVSAPPPKPRAAGWGEDAPLANFPKPVERDHEAELTRAVSAGMRRFEGKHLTLLTDLPPDAEIERLPRAFDLAFPQWCAYFGVNPAQHADWKAIGYLVGDRKRFESVGLFPADLPPFKHGFSRNHEFWLYEQPNAYYRRHLLLHEGTHSFMLTVLGSVGPPWYSEGMAEFHGTHRWDESGLKLGYFPRNREEVPELGRIKLLQDAVEAHQAYQLEQVLKFGPDAHQTNDGYAWCWGLASFLDNHPRYQQRFRQLPADVNSLEFSEQFLKRFQPDLPELREEWQVFVGNVEHAYDQSRMILDFTPGKPLPREGVQLKVAADQGWQNSGYQLRAGQAYSLHAKGRYQLGTEPVTWWSEPGGVSIRYYHHQPLGILLAAVRTEQLPADGRSALLKPIPVGLAAMLRPETDGTLYLRINDSAGELADNVGAADVEVKEAASSP